MKKTTKIFNEINNGLGFIQNLNDKRNEEHQEPFLFLSAERDEDGELPFLNVVCSADDEVLEEMVLKVLEKDPEIRKAILKASRKYQEKQCLKALEAASEGFRKVAELFKPKQFPSGALIAGKPHDEGEEVIIPRKLSEEEKTHIADSIKMVLDQPDKLTALRKERLNLLNKLDSEKISIKQCNNELFSRNSVLAMLQNDLSQLEQEIVRVELEKPKKDEVYLMEDEAKRIFKSSGKLRGDEDYSECDSVIGDYVKGEKLFFFENYCTNEIVIIENYDALRYALTKELIIYKFNLL